MEAPKIENMTLPLKTVVVIILWLGSMASIYFTMKSDLDRVKEDNEKLKTRFDELNPEIITYKISTIEKQLEKIDEKATTIERILSAP